MVNVNRLEGIKFVKNQELLGLGGKALPFQGLYQFKDTWGILVRLVQHVWETGEIPQQMLWTTIVLIPKGNSGDFRGIGLLDSIWKVIERVLDQRLSEIPLHESLHGFRAQRGCGTGIMEAKLTQQLAYLERAPLYGIFVDLHKAYDAMDRGVVCASWRM